MGKHHDWTEISEDFIQNRLSFSQLSKKHGVSISTLKKAAARQGWSDKKRETETERLAKNVEMALDEMEPAEMVPENGTSAEIVPLYMDKILPAEDWEIRYKRLIDELTDRVEEAICNVDVTQAGAVKLLTGALKDLRSLRGKDKDPLDIEEQKARIAKLKSETVVRETAFEPVVVEFIGLDGAEI